MHRTQITKYLFCLILFIAPLCEASANNAGNIVIPVFKRVIKPGVVIIDQDIEYITVADNKTNNIALNASDIIGKSLKHSIYPKTPIPFNVITEPVVIKANQAVTLIYKKENIVLKVAGIALDNGSFGSSIRVRNANSNQIVHGTVKDANIVIVGITE